MTSPDLISPYPAAVEDLAIVVAGARASYDQHLCSSEATDIQRAIARLRLADALSQYNRQRRQAAGCPVVDDLSVLDLPR